MPTYDFRCLMCANKVTVERSISDQTTPQCCGVPMSQIYSAPSVTFKGTGWGKD